MLYAQNEVMFRFEEEVSYCKLIIENQTNN